MPRQTTTPVCCGYTCISEFSPNPTGTHMQDIGNTLSRIQGGVDGKERRFVLSILNADQHTKNHDYLIGHGFVLITVFDNTSGSRCYVYGHVTGSGPVVNAGALMEANTPKKYRPKKSKITEVPNPFIQQQAGVVVWEKIPKGEGLTVVEKAVKTVKKVLAGKEAE